MSVTITLAEPWTYRTPLVTIDYPAGTHVVAPHIAAAAPKVKESNHGPIATPRAPRRSRKAKG